MLEVMFTDTTLVGHHIAAALNAFEGAKSVSVARVDLTDRDYLASFT